MARAGFVLHFRRRREGKTDYKKRLALLKSGKPRLVVRVTNTRIIVQLAQWDSNENKELTLVALDSRELRKMGWKHSVKSVPAAYLTGMLAARRILEKGIKEAVLDIGRHSPTKGARVFAVLKGAVDAGLDIPHSEDKFPSEERIRGEHIDPKMAGDVEKLKKKILGE